MSARSVFITGTDTGVGKTRVACALLRAAAAAGLRAAGFKPVAAGGINTATGFQNEDVLALRRASNVDLEPAEINPYLLREAIAPHIAARREGVAIDAERIRNAHAGICARADLVVIEGAGGWLVPLNEQMTFADLAPQMGWPVILVVGMRLGCLNHALLSAEHIHRHHQLLGWMANLLPPPQPALEENLASLRKRLPGPDLGSLGTDSARLELTAEGRKLLFP